MAFNFESGLSAAGAAVAQTAGVFAAENIRAELEREKITLADTLAGKRESAGRAEAHGYDLEKLDKTQKYDAEKTDKTIAAADRHSAASVGASMFGHKLAAETQLKINDSNIQARAQEHQKTIDASIQSAAKIQIGDDGTAYSVNPITQKVEPFKLGEETLKFRDPDVAKAQVELIKVKALQLNDLTRSYLPQIKSLEDTIRKLQTDPLSKVDKAAQKDLAETQAALKAIQERFDAEKAPLIHELNEMGRSFAAKGKVAVAPGAGGRPPLSSLINIPGATPPTGLPSGGLIDTPY